MLISLGHTDPQFTLRIYTHLKRRDPAVSQAGFDGPHLRIGGRSRDTIGQLTVLLHPRPDALIFPLVVSAAVIATTIAFIPSWVQSLDRQTLAAMTDWSLVGTCTNGKHHLAQNLACASTAREIELTIRGAS